MKSGQKIHCTLTNVVKNECLTFTGPFLGGAGKFEGTVKLIPEGDKGNTGTASTKIDYTFGWGGFMAPLLNLFAGKAARDGTKHGLENMIKLSQEAQQKK